MAPVTLWHCPLGGMCTPNHDQSLVFPMDRTCEKEIGGTHLSSLPGTYLGIGISYT